MSKISENANKLRAEITTIEQFNAIGLTIDVARKYDVSTSVAYLLKKGLEANAKIKIRKVVIEQVKESAEEVAEVAVEEREDVSEALESEGVDDCAEVGKVEPKTSQSEVSECYGTYEAECFDEKVEDESYLYHDVGDLAEPEPTWTAREVEETEEVMDRIMANIDENFGLEEKIKQAWVVVGDNIRSLRELREIEFEEMLLRVIRA
ncbi:hypothetical protein SBF1_50063 [Candidatus Desulfosporosinus infrequens]|uniref:Uncharacterized protein n=1 Tax=Candidatus Desulfosporosinus infrequens TaxID=2043169 RepID=A0A2U3LH90_9FIRM|nr:hypothetical protein SBF1_50063 [Candidatus Desulfosporosinus infrequens]